jgi:hypothetical protein
MFDVGRWMFSCRMALEAPGGKKALPHGLRMPSLGHFSP